MEPGRRRFTLALGAALVVGGTAWPARARAGGHTQISVKVDRTRVQVGDEVTYVIEVSRDDGGDVPEPVLPQALGKGFRIEGPFTGSSFRSSFVNGRVTRSAALTHTYRIVPLQPGSYRLGAHVIDDDGSRVGSNEPLLEVSGTALPTETRAQGARPQSARGDVFLWATVDKPGAYVGEQVLYSLEVYERMRFMNISLRTLPTFQDFWSEELPEGERRSELVDGVPFRVHPGVSRALFPQRAGTLEVGAAEATVGLRGRVSGDAVSVTVRPLPAEGQPAGFLAGNVGRYELEASVDRSTLKQGQPFTLTLTIRGSGNVRVVEPQPWPALDRLRRYDPKVETAIEIGADSDGRPLVGGTRTYEFLLIPEEAGTVVVPAHELIYFDPSTERYETVRTEPIEIEVTPGTPPPPEPSGAAPAGGATADEPGAALMPPVAGDVLPRLQPRSVWLDTKRWVVGMVAIPVVVGGAALGRRLFDRLRGDELARLRAARRAQRRKWLDEARGTLEHGEGFHATVGQLLQDVAVERAGPRGVGLARPALLALLAERGVDGADLDRLQRLLDRCDAARFGAQDADAAARRKLLEEVTSLLRSSTLGEGIA